MEHDKRLLALASLQDALIQLHQEVDLVLVSMKALNTLVSDMVMILSHTTDNVFSAVPEVTDNGDTI